MGNLLNEMDDMLKNQEFEKKMKKKKAKKGVRNFFLLLILVAIVAGVAYWYFFIRKPVDNTLKTAMVDYLKKSNITTVLDFSMMNELQEDLKNKSSESDINFTFTIPMLGLEEYKLNVITENSPTDNKRKSEITFTPEDNSLIVDLLSTEDSIAFYSSEIVNKYVGSSYSELPRVLEGISEINNELTENDEDFSLIDLTSFDPSVIDNLSIILPTFTDEMFAKYADVIANAQIDESSFSVKDVAIDRTDGQRVECQQYMMEVPESKALELLIQVYETFKADSELQNTLAASFSDFGITSDSLNVMAEEKIAELYERTPDDSIKYSLKVYGKDGVTYKVSVQKGEDSIFDIEYYYGDKENSFIIDLLDEEKTGNQIKVSKRTTDVGENIQLDLNFITNGAVDGQATISSGVVKTGSKTTQTNKLSVNYMMFSGSIDISSSISFKNISIVDLDNDNCLFIDKLDEDTFTDVVTAVLEQAHGVINQKSGNTPIVEDEEEEQPDISITDDEREKKAEARQKLFDAVANAMGEAQANGEEYTIQDLVDLRIEGSEYSVSVNSDVAIVNIDGFEFTIDREFHLSD